jgi:CLIP-associating protein 1/2
LITRSTHPTQSASNASLPASSTTSFVSSAAFDVPVLRSALTAFLPTGGVIDRLGDKEKAQANARESLVLLGGYAFRAGGTKLGKGQETPLTFFERVLKEGGLGSKVWKVREQVSCMDIHLSIYLMAIRQF